MAVGDAAFLKKINRASIIRYIIKKGMISRADLSNVTNLTRATISAQVADLLEEGLLVEKELEHSSVGRRPIALSLNSKAGYALGVDLDFGQIHFTLSDLLGQPISSKLIKIETTDYSDISHLLIEQINQFKSQFSDTQYGIVGIGIAIHGLVSKDQRIHYVPRLQWQNIDLKGDLEKTINIPIYIENNANLSAFAECVYTFNNTHHLLSVSLYSGVGLGMMINNEFFTGSDGYAGEAGHMIVVPGGRACSCGNKGCWEKYSSESIIFEILSEKKQKENLSYEDIKKWIEDGDEEVLDVLNQGIYYLSIGLNNLINMYNPDVLVLDSELIRMYPNSLTLIQDHLSSSINHYKDLKISIIGRKSAVLGACAYAIKQFLDVTALSLPFNDEIKNMNY